MRLIASVKTALQQRQDKKDQYLSSLTDVEAKQIAHNKIALATAKEDQASVKLVSVAHLFRPYPLQFHPIPYNPRTALVLPPTCPKLLNSSNPSPLLPSPPCVLWLSI